MLTTLLEHYEQEALRPDDLQTVDCCLEDERRRLLDERHLSEMVLEDGDLAMVEVESKNKPSQDASRVLAKGTIRLRVAASSTTEKIENLKLEVGHISILLVLFLVWQDRYLSRSKSRPWQFWDHNHCIIACNINIDIRKRIIITFGRQ